jgi:hypothetical protein
MTVVQHGAWRRWTAVAGGVLVLCLLPVALAAWPAAPARIEPGQLRQRILASAGVPYQGYADTQGAILLPDVPAVRDVARLLRATRLRAWYTSPSAWRVAILETTGERDLYRTASGTYAWDFERSVTTLTVGDLPVRLPTAADLLPPDLARRILAEERSVAPLGARRVAGITAAGLRLTPTDPDTTIGRVDVWADPRTGLPVQVEIAQRGADDPIFTTRFLDLEQRAPAPDLLVPPIPPSSTFVTTTAADVVAAVNGTILAALPPTLAGRDRRGTGAEEAIAGLAAYGTGLSMVVVLALPGRVGFDALTRARDRGGQPVPIDGAEAYEASAGLVNGIIVRTTGERRLRRTYVLAGPVALPVLRQAAAELSAATTVTGR